MISLQEYLAQGQTTVSNLLLENYHSLGLTNDEFVLWLQLYRYHEQGNDFPDLAMIAKGMGSEQKEIYKWLNELLNKQIIAIESKKDSAGKMVDYYEFSGIYERLEVCLRQKISRRKSRAMIQKYVRFIKCLSPNLAVRFQQSNTSEYHNGWKKINTSRI